MVENFLHFRKLAENVWQFKKLTNDVFWNFLTVQANDRIFLTDHKNYKTCFDSLRNRQKFFDSS